MRRVLVRSVVLLLSGVLAQGLVSSREAWAERPQALGASVCAAQPKPEDAATKERVTAAYNRGLEASRADKWPEAMAAFSEAWSLREHYQIAANLGRAEFMVGRHWEAAEHLRFFVRHAPPDVSAEEKNRAQEMFEKALTRVGSVTVNVNVPGAEVLVDGKRVGCAPLAEPVFAEPGRRTIEARSPGYTAARESADVAAGAEPTIRLQLVKAGPVDGDQQKTDSGGAGKPNKKIIVAGAVVTVALAGACGVSTGLAHYYAGERRRPLMKRTGKYTTRRHRLGPRVESELHRAVLLATHGYALPDLVATASSNDNLWTQGYR